MTNQTKKQKILQTKVIGLDIYGTVLSTIDADNVLPPREGIKDFFEMCKKRKILIASCSDADIDNVKIDLRETFERRNISNVLNYFNNFLQLNQLPVKDFALVLRKYGISPNQLLVIGDSYKDIEGAIRIGSPYVKVNEYREKDDSTFVQLTKDLEKLIQ